MFEQTFKNIDDILHKDAGCSNELDYVEQTSWVLFLKYLDDLENERCLKAELDGNDYNYLIEEKYRWNSWAAPKTADGKIDRNIALTGDDLKDFVDHELFPYLKNFKTIATSADSLEYKIGEIFNELKNKLQSGYTLRGVIDLIDQLRFQSSEEKHEMSHLYEDKIKNMGNAGRNGGEYYTPRPLIKTIIKLLILLLVKQLLMALLVQQVFYANRLLTLKKNIQIARWTRISFYNRKPFSVKKRSH